jgi:excisionase family DNA binding protein
MIQGLITVAEAAQLKGVTRSVLYKAIERGDLKVQLVLGRKALRRRDVLAWEPRRAGRRRGIPTSEEAKGKISASQKARWQKRKQDEA